VPETIENEVMFSDGWGFEALAAAPGSAGDGVAAAVDGCSASVPVICTVCPTWSPSVTPVGLPVSFTVAGVVVAVRFSQLRRPATLLPIPRHVLRVGAGIRAG
jgi:hypothetical protein